MRIDHAKGIPSIGLVQDGWPFGRCLSLKEQKQHVNSRMYLTFTWEYTRDCVLNHIFCGKNPERLAGIPTLEDVIHEHAKRRQNPVDASLDLKTIRVQA